MAPTMINAPCQPNLSAIHGTVSGARIAPILVPELKTPVARARSRFGNHSAVVLIAAAMRRDSMPASRTWRRSCWIFLRLSWRSVAR